MTSNKSKCDNATVLILLVSQDGEAGPREIGMALRPMAASGEAQAESARKVLRPLSKKGHVAKLGPGRYRITERGRLAAALAMAGAELAARR